MKWLFYPDFIPTKFADEFFVRILFDPRFLRVEPLGEGEASPFLLLWHYMLQGGISVSTRVLPTHS